MHLYYFAGSRGVSAETTRSILECELIDQHHWLPQDIEKIPYKKLQTYLAVRKHKTGAVEAKVNVEKMKSSLVSKASGQTKRYREV